ncbi:hypothetical protein [Mycobacterium aquaticum]|uniref:Uncharacterized protein n=1 Tax=Mycobacterium aquaticum TaxID=1927124 RepID=A0A1X0B7B8_9MYCO|nr:hypothetical protein [Mycobacterium aquaticum]ORA38105.1 hypothetical protein BST13_05780 [Mycobacterium aquaticum]
MTTAFSPVVFDAPLVNPAPNGLFGATQWTDEDGPLRWLASGVDIRVFNYGGGAQFGVWEHPWCVSEDDLDPETDAKRGVRPEFPDTFTAFTSWASDECDVTQRSRDEVRVRAQQVHRLQEPNAVEAKLATRMLADAGTAGTAAGVVAAVAFLEGLLAKTNTVGQIHASAEWAAFAAYANLVRYNGSKLVTPLGHQWVFGGGYVDGLGSTLVATSPTFGWRGPVVLRDAPTAGFNEFVAVAERSLVVGYEELVAAVKVTAPVAGDGFPGLLNFPGSANFPSGG